MCMYICICIYHIARCPTKSNIPWELLLEQTMGWGGHDGRGKGWSRMPYDIRERATQDETMPYDIRERTPVPTGQGKGGKLDRASAWASAAWSSVGEGDAGNDANLGPGQWTSGSREAAGKGGVADVNLGSAQWTSGSKGAAGKGDVADVNLGPAQWTSGSKGAAGKSISADANLGSAQWASGGKGSQPWTLHLTSMGDTDEGAPNLTLITYGQRYPQAVQEVTQLADVVMGVTHLWDPSSKTRCTGYNGGVQFNISLMDELRGRLATARALLQPVLSGSRRMFSLGVFCKSGRHRSVAFAILLKQAILTEHPGMRIKVCHANFEECGCPGNCRNGTLQDQERWAAEGVVAEAVVARLWMRLKDSW